MCVWEVQNLSGRLGSAFCASHVCIFVCLLFFLSRDCWLWGVNSAHQWVPCTVHRTHKPHFLVTFFIKNGSHDTIHTFKNYFATVFSVVSKWTLSVINYFLSVKYFRVKIFLRKKKKNRTMGWIVHRLPVYTISLINSVFIFQSIK